MLAGSQRRTEAQDTFGRTVIHFNASAEWNAAPKDRERGTSSKPHKKSLEYGWKGANLRRERLLSRRLLRLPASCFQTVDLSWCWKYASQHSSHYYLMLLKPKKLPFFWRQHTPTHTCYLSHTHTNTLTTTSHCPRFKSRLRLKTSIFSYKYSFIYWIKWGVLMTAADYRTFFTSLPCFGAQAEHSGNRSMIHLSKMTRNIQLSAISPLNLKSLVNAPNRFKTSCQWDGGTCEMMAMEEPQWQTVPWFKEIITRRGN